MAGHQLRLRLLNKLYVRIWLAVVLAVAVLTLLVAWVWRLAAELPPRDIVVRNPAGQIIGNGQSRRMDDDDALGHHGRRMQGPMRWRNVPPLPSSSDPTRIPADPSDHVSEFVVRMNDGQMMRMHLMRPPPPFWSRPPFGFAWMLVWVGVAVALATYPIVRKLTRRLEQLQNGVQQWGEGNLSVRISESGQDEVAFLASRFNQAAQRIQTLIQSHEALLASQKSLLANASHELRSPLARIRMGLELMGTPASPAFKAEIERNIAELDQLIGEILLASRLDAREADLGSVESVDLVGLAAEECARTGAELEMDANSTDLAVSGVSKLLRRAVRNLLENARRYAVRDITVHLSHTTTHAIIRVSDRGPGVPDELRERIFEPFYRLPGATERDGGVGLGLALVKSIAERHGGQVRCENRAGGGACFVLELPLRDHQGV